LSTISKNKVQHQTELVIASY